RVPLRPRTLDPQWFYPSCWRGEHQFFGQFSLANSPHWGRWGGAGTPMVMQHSENSSPGLSAGTWFSNTLWAQSPFLLVGRGMWSRFCETSAFISLPNYLPRGGPSLLWRMEHRSPPSL